jgi:hypothetical protein
MSQSGILGASGGGGGGAVNTLTGNTGGPVGPTGGGTINIIGAGGVAVAGNAGTNTLTITAGVSNLTFDTDGTPATSVGGVISTVGDGVNIDTNGAGSTVTISLANSPVISGSLTVGTTLTVSGLGLGVVQTDATGLFSSSAGNNGQVLIGGNGVAPAWANISPGTGIAITNTSGGITIDTTGGGFTWHTVGAATQNLSAANGYIANNAGGVAFLLPAAATPGATIKITTINAGGFTVTQNAGQTIHLGVDATTTGVTGFLQSTANYDSIELVCTVTNTTWTVVNSVGNFNLL